MKNGNFEPKLAVLHFLGKISNVTGGVLLFLSKISNVTGEVYRLGLILLTFLVMISVIDLFLNLFYIFL